MIPVAVFGPILGALMAISTFWRKLVKGEQDRTSKDKLEQDRTRKSKLEQVKAREKQIEQDRAS
jgi:hypothetical protein